MNNVTFTGNLCADPELKQTPNGISVCRFRLAVRRPYKTDAVDFLTCVAWRHNAEFLASYAKKGSRMGVKGRLETDSYEKNGQKFYTFEIVCEEVELLDSTKKDNAASGSDAAAYVPGAYQSQNQNFEELPEDRDLPF